MIRLGIVPYLNVLPLLEGLDATFPAHQWLRATPRQLGEALQRRDLDIAIVSTFEGLRCGYQLLPGAMIGANGPVRSVALYSKVPLHQIRHILLDRASLSSVALVRILANDLLQIDPVYETSPEPFTPEFCWQDNKHDALVVIGDTALAWEHTFPYTLDLGEGWKRLTGLPFVFAGWYARPGVQLSPTEIAAFATARAQGTNAINTIVARIDPKSLTPIGGPESLRHYLSQAIHYDLTPAALEGLKEFERRLKEKGLLG